MLESVKNSFVQYLKKCRKPLSCIIIYVRKINWACKIWINAASIARQSDMKCKNTLVNGAQ